MSSRLHRYVASWVRTQYRKRLKTALYSFLSRSSASASNSSSSSRWLTVRIVALRGRREPCRFREFSATERDRPAARARIRARAGADGARRGPARRPSRRRRGAGRGRSCAAPTSARRARGRAVLRRRAGGRAAGAASAWSRSRRRRSGTWAGSRGPTARSRGSRRDGLRRSARLRGGAATRGRRGSSRDRRTQASWPLDGDGAELDREARRHDLGLADPYADTLGSEPLQQGVGKRRRERFEQPESCFVHLADRRRHLGVVDRVRELVVGAALTDLQLDVVEEALAVALLFRVCAVEAVQLEPAQLDLHAPTTALAAARASTCSRTSWARRMVAPRS